MNKKLFRASVSVIWTSIISLVAGGFSLAEVPHVKIGRFPQEVAKSYSVADGLPSDDVLEVHLDKGGSAWARTDKGWAVLKEGKWSAAGKPGPQTLPGRTDPQKAHGDRCPCQSGGTGSGRPDCGGNRQGADDFK